MRVVFMKVFRQRRNRYVVSIFLADDVVEFPMNDRLSIPLTRLFGGTVRADDNRTAAAQAWIQHVGKYRHDRLVAFRAPTTHANAEFEPSVVAKQLVPASLCPVDGGFLLDNGVEVWLISVRQV